MKFGKLFENPALKSRITSSNVKIQEMAIGYFLAPMCAMLANSIFGAYLSRYYSDVLGWITIPDTVISYPLMKAKDNQEYLYQTWDGKYSKFGSIFLECRNSHDLSDFNTLIYGHNMLTDDMFGTLLEYADQSHYESHPSVYVVTDSGVRRYDIFSAYEANVISDTYRLVFEDDARRQSALELYTSSSVLDTGLIPGVTDSILTLSTCTGRGTANLRFVVQAVLAEEVLRGE